MNKTKSECCAIPHEGAIPTCPLNGQATKPVGRKTVEALVKSEIAAELRPQPYFFCDAPGCDAVYVSALGDHLVLKDSLVVRVGIKETVDPVPLCYCFGYDRKMVWDDIRANGDTNIQKVITQKVRDGECQCEITNPSGGCCLGTVSHAIKQAKAMKEQGLL